MEDILELQRQLAEAQQASSSKKLSDRNCVELVMKLQSLNLIDVIFTRSGREYLTHHQLTKEIEEQIADREGRVNIVELPEALNVDLVHIEAKLQGILEKQKGKMQLVRGEVLCDYYLSSLVKDVIEALDASESGVDTVGAVASRFNLPAKVISDTLTKQQGEGFTASFEPATGILRSNTFVQKARALARESLLAVNHPSPLADIAEPLQVPMNILLGTLDEMRKSGEIDGEIDGRGARALFVPTRFSLEAFKLASADLFKNEFISFVQLENMAINNPVAFVAKTDSSAVTLDTCIVSSSLFNALESAISECKVNESWIDGRALLPPDFPDDDISSVIAKASEASLGEKSSEVSSSKEKKNKKSRKNKQSKSDESVSFTETIFAGRFVLSLSALQKIKQALVLQAQSASSEFVQPFKTIVESGALLPWTNKKINEAQQNADENAGKKGKSKNRRRGNKKDDKAHVVDPVPGNTSSNRTGAPSMDVPSAIDVVQLLSRNEKIRRLLITDDLGNTGLLEDVLTAVIDGVYGDYGLENLYNDHVQEALLSLEKRQVEREQAFDREVLNSLDKIAVYDRNADTLEEKKFIDASRNCCFQTIIVPTVVSILRRLALVKGIPWSVEVDYTNVLQSDRLKRLRDVQRQFPSDIESRLKPFISSLAVKPSKGFSSFLTAYDKLSGHLNLPRRHPVDKKKDRALSMAIRAELLERLQNETISSQTAFECIVVLLHAKWCNGSVVLLPSRLVGEYSVLIEEALEFPEIQVALQQVRSSAEEESRSDAQGTPIITKDELQERRTILEFVR